MKVGDSVRKAIDDWEQGDFEAAMLHACNAVDGTGAKAYPGLGNKARFTRLLRENYAIFGPLAAPGIAMAETTWPVSVQKPSGSGGKPDIADVIYGIHRCTHGHGDELPDGFDLLPDAAGPNRLTRMVIEKGKVRLSDRVLFGLLAVAILSPTNADQRVPDGYHLTFAGIRLDINEWWGRAVDFADVVAREPMPSVTLNFGDWMDEPK
jgi:hypothetical protein